MTTRRPIPVSEEAYRSLTKKRISLCQLWFDKKITNSEFLAQCAAWRDLPYQLDKEKVSLDRSRLLRIEFDRALNAQAMFTRMIEWMSEDGLGDDPSLHDRKRYLLDQPVLVEQLLDLHWFPEIE